MTIDRPIAMRSSVGRILRRSRICMKQERERRVMWSEKLRVWSKITSKLRSGEFGVNVWVDAESKLREIDGFVIFWVVLCKYKFSFWVVHFLSRYVASWRVNLSLRGMLDGARVGWLPLWILYVGFLEFTDFITDKHFSTVSQFLFWIRLNTNNLLS